MIIQSAQNERIKEIKKLLSKPSYREERGLFVVEGVRMAGDIPLKQLDSLYISESLYEKQPELVRDVEEDRLFILKDSLFGTICATKNPQGILALVKIIEYNLYDFFERAVEVNDPFLFIIDHLQDPGNLGTILRTAEAAGATGGLISQDTVDPYNPKVIRSTMGSIFRVPLRIAQDFPEEIQTIKERGVTIYGAHLSGGAFYDENFSEGCGFLIGNEGNGLSEKISALADHLIRIPMEGRVESLNAAVSTAVIAYEVFRQRR